MWKVELAGPVIISCTSSGLPNDSMTFLLMNPGSRAAVRAREKVNPKSLGDGALSLSRTCVHQIVLNARHFAEEEIQGDSLFLRIASINQVLELQNALV